VIWSSSCICGEPHAIECDQVTEALVQVHDLEHTEMMALGAVAS
jgi:hypothetical protein